MTPLPLYRPPAPRPSSPIRSLWRVIRQGDGDLLSLVPEEAYREPVVWLGYSRRSILLVNDPALCRSILADHDGVFPKNDLMVGALEGLVGDSIFVSSGERWRRQRRMIEPAFSQLRIDAAFDSMVAAVDDAVLRLDRQMAEGATVSLDLTMSQLAADVICRTLFSTSLDSDVAREVFDDFLVFERGVASVNLRELIIGKPWAKVQQPAAVQQACQRIRRHIGELLDRHAALEPAPEDIVSAIREARDPETGDAFSREELIDQVGVFFLAGHETTASVLTWVFFILAQRAELRLRLHSSIDAVVGNEPVQLSHVRRLPLVRNVFRETLRLYPPITFLPRVAWTETRIADRRVKRGAMIMVSPWTAHRNERLWRQADRFDVDRYTRDDESESGLHLAFGVGPRVCIGAHFATTEATLIITRLLRRYDIEILEPSAVRPVARLTTRPATEIRCRLQPSSHRPFESST